MDRSAISDFLRRENGLPLWTILTPGTIGDRFALSILKGHRTTLSSEWESEGGLGLVTQWRRGLVYRGSRADLAERFGR